MDKFLEFLKDEENLTKPLTLFAGIVGILLTEAALDGFVKELFTAGQKRRLLIYSIPLIVWVVIWFHKRTVYPRVPKDKIGLVIAVTTESIKARIRLRADLVHQIKETIGGSSLNGLVHIILLNNYQSEQVRQILDSQRNNLIALREHGSGLDEKTEAAWQRIQKRMRARGFIFGRIKERLAGESSYILESNALVTLPTLKDELQKGIDKEFGSIWTHRIQIEEKVEFIGFPLSGKLMFIPVAYILGIAALMMRDVFTALKFHEPLMQQTDSLGALPEIAEVRKKLVTILAEEHTILARYYYEIKPDIVKVRAHLTKGLSFDPRSHMGLVFKSNIDFSIDKNPVEALNSITLARASAGQEGTWRYNEGFLLTYLERFDKALTVYRAIGRSSYEGEIEIVKEVINFNKGILEKEPAKIQCLYILGYLQFRKTKNLVEAQHHFETFLTKSGKEAKYKSLQKDAEKYLTQIKSMTK